MIVDFGGGFFLRHATADDHPALCMVCLKTGDAGKDATGGKTIPRCWGISTPCPTRCSSQILLSSSTVLTESQATSSVS